MTKSILIPIFLFGFLTIHAQKNREELNEFFWGKNDAYKNEVAIPEKYKNESAVILYKLEDYDYHKFATNVDYTEYLRIRVKLQDQAAISDFTEYEFNENNYREKTVFGIKVIKPDGKEIIIDVDKETVKIDKKRKIAIPSLTIGDIIDIYQYYTESFMSIADYGFEPVERTLGSNYPILKYKLTFQTENDFFVNFNTYNGAPELKKVEIDKSNERRYELIATDIPKNDFPRWFFPLVELPSYKFQVYFARKGKFEKWADAFLPEKESEIKSTVSKEDVFNFYNKKFSPSPSYMSLDVEDILKNKTYKNDEEKVKAIYYYARHQYLTRYIEAMVIDKQNIFYPYDLYGNSPIFFSTEISFVNYFMMILKKININYDIIVGTYKENGPIKDLLLESNTTVLLKVYTEKPMYFGYFSPYTTPDLFPHELEGTEAYALKVSGNKKVDDIEVITLPKTTHKDNISSVNVNLKITPEFDKIETIRISSLIGHNKDYESDKITYLDYVNEDHGLYNTTAILDLVKNKNKRDEYQKKYNAFINKMKEDNNVSFKESLETEFSFEIENQSLEMLNFGRFGSNDSLQFKETFTVTSPLIKKAGNNYTFEIGRFISSQVEIEEKEYKRENNIYMTFPRTFKVQIVLEIPEGYSIVGLDKLQKNVQNETGSFVSTASVQGNQLIIFTNKEYYNYFEPKENWLKMVEFLDAAYQFTQEKILLKKN